MTISNIIKQLEGTASSKEKLRILQENKDNETLREFFYLALSPEVVFGIKKVPEYQYEEDQSLEWAMDSLYPISSRQYTGNMAIEYLSRILCCISTENADLVERIIKKDPACGVSEKTVNKIWLKLIPEFPVALCERNTEKNRRYISFPAIVQLKEDGLRFIAIVENGNVSFRSRNGKTIDLLGELEDEFLELAGVMDCAFDGEALVVDKNGGLLPRKIGNGILNKAIKGTISPEEAKMIRVHLWDCIPLDDFWNGRCLIPYHERGAQFHSMLSNVKTDRVDFVETWLPNSWKEIEEIFKQQLSLGKEGLIVKDAKSIWENKRLKNHIKFKAEKSADLLCISTIPHSKNPNMIGSLVLQTSCGKLEVGCGSGLSDADRLKNPSEYIDKVIEIVYNEIIDCEGKEKKSLFLPIFQCVRNDKAIANSLEELA